MDNMGIIKKLPTMLSGWNLDAAMEILPDYDRYLPSLCAQPNEQGDL